MRTLTFQPMNLGRLIVWGGFALMLLLAPACFSQPASLSLLSQIGTMMIFALSYNILLGQGGMLSFGHAVYSGLGAFIAVHAMNLASGGKMWLPVYLVPLLGGVAGMFFGVLFGYVTTRKSGTTFAMITLGLVELVAACSLMFPGFFGGEGGVSTNRVYGDAVLGINFGAQIQVYYLIAVYLLASSMAMFAFTRTPLGRILNAVRDNPERVEFLGYDSQWVRYLSLIISAFFAGIAGGLNAINFEIVSAENVSAVRSGAVLLFTFIGGVGFFFGPMLGALFGVLLSVVMADHTKAWQLYLGLFFMLMVLYAPGGVASLVLLSMKVVASGKLGRIWRAWLVQAASALCALIGLVLAVEMLYQRTMEVGGGTEIKLWGMQIDTHATLPWLAALALFGVGAICFLWRKAHFSRQWDEMMKEIMGGGGR